MLETLLGFLIGITLGLLGGGGSILTVPTLVYLVGQSPQMAVTASLVIVGANSAFGVALYRAQGTLNGRVALVFGGAGMAFAYVGGLLSKHISPNLLMVAFALLMLGVGASMLRKPKVVQHAPQPASLRVILASGVVVGLLTGFLGVGGGFLIVPALVMLVGLPMREAVGTSLVVIAMNSAAGFLGHLDALSLDVALIVTFTLSGMAGVFVGSRLAKHIAPHHLRHAFALFVMGLAVFLLLDNVL
jgi:uncharacterized membrane protein YfcA